MSGENYDGDYNIGISDKGRVSFNLNFKWLLAIAFSVLSFIGWLLIDKYYIVPMAEKDTKIEELIANDEAKDEILKTMGENIKILLDRSEYTQDFIRDYRKSHIHQDEDDEDIDELPHTSPGE